MTARLPRVGPAPPGGRGVALGTLLSAWLLLLPASLHPWRSLPGDAAFPDLGGTVNYHWLVQQRGLLGATHSRLLMFPQAVDRIVADGFPLDALADRPFLALFGWPLGFTLFQLCSLWALGLAMAWLSGRWWRSTAAAWVGGVAIQASAVVLNELAFGRPTQVFGLIFLPLAVGLFSRALVRERIGGAVLAGAFAGLGVLSYWFFAMFTGAALFSLWGLALWEGRRTRAPVAGLVAGGLLVTALPMLYVLGGSEPQAAMELGLWSPVHHAGGDVLLAELLHRRALPLRWLWTPALFSLAVWGAWGARPRRRLAPLVWIGLGLAGALGPWIHLPGGVDLPGPTAIFAQLPLSRRLWWPDRWWLLAAPGLALLAAGGAARLPWLREGVRGPLLVGLLLVEAAVSLPSLPLPAADGRLTASARALAQDTGPLLVLPSVSGAFRRDARPLIDQLFHGRPLVNGAMPPSSQTAPRAYRAASALPGLAHLYGCEWTPGGRFEGSTRLAREQLRGVGLTQVAVAMDIVEAAMDDPAPYLRCVQSLLGEEHLERGPFWLYEP